MGSPVDSVAHDMQNPQDISTLKQQMGQDARLATESKHSMTFFEGLKLYPTAVAWSAFFSIGIIMCAFDPQLLGSLYATPAFQKDFGYLFEDFYIISALWQSGLSMGSPVGQVVGALAAGYPMDWYGRKKTFLACVIASTGCIFIQFFARSLSVLLAGELLGGLILGTYATIAPNYASEVCPVTLRGVLTAYINMCFVTGQLLANGVIAGSSRLDNHWAYSTPFAIQWLWPLIIFAGIYFAPESPWWLVRQGRLEEAEKALISLSSAQVDNKPTLAMMIETDRLEHEMETGTTYLDCFKKINLRRTEISVGVYSIQVFSGIYLVGYATYFFQLAGLSGSKAFEMSVGFLAVGFAGTILCYFLLPHVGRRRITTLGSPSSVIWNGIYGSSIGPVTFIIICEASATKVRSRTIAVATAVQALFGIVMTVAIPYMINPDQANIRCKLGFFFGGLSAICFVWAWFRIPETYGRTYEELDLMFEKNLKTREFKHYKIV